MRVLFVDDEPRVLEALERVLWDIESSWETVFCTNAEEAFVALEQHAYDVIVSDLRMSGTDGVALLTRVRDLSPRTVRIVLSGHSDEEAALRMVGVAHQFLAKPCAAETLHRIIARTAQLTEMLGDRKLQSLVGQIGGLPSPPELHRELHSLLEEDEVTAADVAAVVRRDPAMTAKLLQISSSAFFNTSTSVADVETAIMRLGFRTLRNLALGFGAFQATDESARTATSAVVALQSRSVAIAETAASMAKLPEDAAAAYVAGLLCDVGELVLVRAAPERLYVTQSEAAQLGVLPHVAERATWGATHAEMGAFLLGLWGLPFQVVEAVACHHTPERLLAGRVGLSHYVWLASCIVQGEQPELDTLQRIGMGSTYAEARRKFEERAS